MDPLGSQPADNWKLDPRELGILGFDPRELDSLKFGLAARNNPASDPEPKGSPVLDPQNFGTARFVQGWSKDSFGQQLRGNLPTDLKGNLMKRLPCSAVPAALLSKIKQNRCNGVNSDMVK